MATYNPPVRVASAELNIWVACIVLSPGAARFVEPSAWSLASVRFCLLV